MASILLFAFVKLLDYLLQAIIWVVVANAIISWLIAFDVINMRNRVAYNVVRFLDQVTRPLLAPLRRFIPPLGGIDITPVILIIVITTIDQTLHHFTGV
ncbi:MAG TPA: YggT family protein [Caulobacteraceae bacterium]|nr:YggT family protein [Caulobacteraceae bacterium]